MWCIHNKKQVCWTYWIFNQMLSCAPCKDAPLTHGYVVTIIAKALNINIANSLLNDAGMIESFNQLLTQCGLMKFVSMHEDTIVDLIIEFYTTLDVNVKNS